MPQTAQVAQTQAPVNCAPNADQPQNLPQTAQVAQTQAPVSIAPNADQPQNLPQTAQFAQTQAPVNCAPNADQPQNLPQTAQVAQTQAPVSIAQNADQPQNLPQTAQVAQTQGPAPFAAPVAPPTSEESVSPVETLVDAAPLENAPLVNVEPSVLAAATPGESASQNNEQKNVSGTLTSQADDSAVSSSVAASQNPENAQNLTAHIGRRNPGLFAAPAASNAKIDFRPGSISTTAPLVAQNAPTTQDVQVAQNAPTTQDVQVAQNALTTQDFQIAQNAPTTQDDQLAPNALTPQDAQVAQTAPIVGPQLPETSRFNVETAFRLVDRLVDLENCVAEYFAPLAPLYETAPSPFQVVEPEELYAAAPSPVELEDAEDEEFDENDDFAFASSGTSQPQPTAAPVATIGGFGSYQAPTFDATSAFAAPIPAQNSAEVQTTQVPSVPQNAQIANLPQAVQTTQVPGLPQNAQIANLPQAVQTTQVPQYVAPPAPHRPSTSEERLQAAIAAGAEVREISPEEYRRAVSVGMSGQAQPR